MADCDVAIVGAGIVGGSIGFELAARGASVTLLDSRGAGFGATQASAGMLVPYIEGFGHPILRMAARSLAMYDAFIDRVTRDSGIGVGYQRTGSLQVETAAGGGVQRVTGRARDPPGFEVLAHRTDVQLADDIALDAADLAVVESHELHARLPSHARTSSAFSSGGNTG